MATDFTDSELEYRDLVRSLDEAIRPKYDVSVFRQPLETRRDLLNTIIYRDIFKNYHLATQLIHEGMVPPFQNNPFSNFKEKDYSHNLCKSINSYFRDFNYPVKTEADLDRDSLEKFLRHYEINIELLLRGPPHADDHVIDRERADTWLGMQKTEERRRLANLFLRHLIYISHTELKETLRYCVERVRERLVDGVPIIFIIGYPEKSNYYISLLFYHYWKEAGLPLHGVKSHLDTFVPGNIIDIDEMAYSGSQTTQTLANVYGSLLLSLQERLNEMNESISYQKTKIFLPIPFLEFILFKNKINYLMLRAFCGEKGEASLRKMPIPYSSSSDNQLKPPFQLIIGKKIPSPETLFGKEDADKLSLLFGPNPGYPSSTVYFNHKVADPPSTFINPIAFGVVPEQVLLRTEPDWKYEDLVLLKNLQITPQPLLSKARDPEYKNKGLYNDLSEYNKNKPAVEYYPFIRHCYGPARTQFPSRNQLISKTAPPEELRCPHAWYKLIDYDTGTYPKKVSGGRHKSYKSKKQRRITRRVKTPRS
jgi:hypothetical protein